MTRARSPIRWVLLDTTGGAPCQSGETLSPSALERMAQAATLQLNRDFGCDDSVRAGASPTDVQPDERPYAFCNGLPEAPGAEAYHDVDPQGAPYGREDFTGCASIFGPMGALMAASHEFLETAGDPGCNRLLDDRKGTLHFDERCDAVEVQGYDVGLPDGQPAFVSNFLLDSWGIPGAPGPYTFMGANNYSGAIEPAGPMETAPGAGGNYQGVEPAPDAQPTQVTAMHAGPGRHFVIGRPAKPAKVAHWSSRLSRRERVRGQRAV